MAAAQDVRCAFLRNLAGSKKHAKVMTEWAISRIVLRDRTVARWLHDYNPKVLGELLGNSETERLDRTLAALPASKHHETLWLIVCSAYEAEWHKDCWRSPDQARAAYLGHLVSLGYTPCDTEQLVLAAQ